MKPSDQKGGYLFPILLVNFIGSLGFSIVLPFLVVIVLKFGGNEVVYGFLGATYSFFQLIGAPVLGNWSDRVGRRKILLLSEAGTFIAWIIFLIGLLLPNHKTGIHLGGTTGFIFSIPLVLVFFARALDGITGGNISVANAYLADVSAKKDRKQNFGKMSASANLGFILGPLLAGLLGVTSWGSILPVAAAVLISLTGLIVIYFKIRESHIITDNSTVRPNKNSFTDQQDKIILKPHSNGFAGLLSVLKLPSVCYFMVLYFLIFLGFNFFYVSFPVYVAGQLHWSVLQLGIFFSFLSGALVLVQGPVLSFCAKHFSGAVLVITGSALLSICFILLRFNNIVVIYTGALFFALGNGLMWPSFNALLSNTGNENTQGKIQGFASSSGSLASIIGLICGAFLYHTLGAGLFLLTAVFMLIIAFLAIPLIKIEKKM
jgi:DHA1 family tetracycline resistance protein-like MFS transporter